MGNMENVVKGAAMTYLFGAYGRSTDGIQYRVYCDGTARVPANVLEKAVRILTMTSDFLPPLSAVLRTSRKVLREERGIPENKPFAAVQKEIIDGINRVWYVGCLGEVSRDDPSFGQPCKPKWSSDVVAKLYDLYSDALSTAKVGDTALYAQMRATYQGLVDKDDEDLINKVVALRSQGNGQDMVALVGGNSNGSGAGRRITG